MTAHINGSNPLTVRQMELLALVVSGMTIENAADQVHIAKQSAYNTLSQARSKVDATTVTHLAVIAIERGWLVKSDRGGYSPATQLQAA